MNDSKEISFDDVSADHLEKYLIHAIETVLKRQARAKYSHDKNGHELPKIMINPPPEKVLKAGRSKTITKIVETKEELSQEFQKQLDDETKKRHDLLKKKYDERITLLQGQILALESHIGEIVGELDQYVKGTHPHIANHFSPGDLESDIKALEYKLSHLESRGEKYHDLVNRLKSARARLHALDV